MKINIFHLLLDGEAELPAEEVNYGEAEATGDPGFFVTSPGFGPTLTDQASRVFVSQEPENKASSQAHHRLKFQHLHLVYRHRAVKRRSRISFYA